jgi:hypothetical protein
MVRQIPLDPPCDAELFSSHDAPEYARGVRPRGMEGWFGFSLLGPTGSILCYWRVGKGGTSGYGVKIPGKYVSFH